MSNYIINKEGDYKNETVSSVPLGINNLKINSENNFDLKKDQISNIKPMLSSSSNTITIPDGKKVKIKPNLNKKVPMGSISMMANPKKNMGANASDDSSYSSGSSSGSGTDEILSNSNTGTSYTSQKNSKYSKTSSGSTSSSGSYEDDDDYSSIDSNVHKNNSNTSYSEYTEEDDDDDETASVPAKEKSYEEIQQEKQELLFNLERLQRQGYPPSKKYSMASSYEEIKFEHNRLKKQRDVEKSIKFSRKMLMAFVSGAEYLNNRFDYFDIKLNGWSENVMSNVSDYDEVFEELHGKYGESIKMEPEFKLLAMISSSAFMFHLTNSFFKSATPKMSDILKNNPDIMRNVTEAAARDMKNNISREFGENDEIGNLMKGGIDMRMNQQGPPRGPPPQPQNFNRNPVNQQKMTGPLGIDELLDELNNDNGSTGSGDNVNIKSFPNRTKNGGKRGGIQLDLR